ncbi:MAG: ethanolamine permease [Bradymonadia bacterium]
MTQDNEKVGSIAYTEVEEGYFEKRTLRPYARALHLWALGVGAVISGDFFGWNFGLASGGFGGMLIALCIVTVMYLGLCFSIAEMSAALPHTGGAYSFARSSLGPWGAYITGLSENMEYVLTPAVIVAGIGGYLGDIVGTDPSLAPVWWAAAYGVFLALNIWGVEISFKFSVVITILALLILAVFYIGALSHADIGEYALDIPPDPTIEGSSTWLPKGWQGIFAALPFAIWFYLAIEELPLAAEESHDPQKDIPRGLILGILTLIVCAFGTLILNTSIPPGAHEISTSKAPLFDGFKTIFGAGVGAKLLACIAVAGLVASFHTIIFAYGRQIYSLSRAGYFPRVLSLTHSTRQTPHVALLVGAAVGYLVAFVIYLLGEEHPVGAVLLNMAVFGAMIAYILQMLSFIMLRIKMPNIERPYRSPFGMAGAIAALLLSVMVLVTLFIMEPVYRKVVIGAAIWFLLGLLYFALVGRHKLVKSPEEEFALQQGE